MTDAAVAGPQVIIGLGIAIFVMIYLVLKTRVHALLALIIAASLAGLIGGMYRPMRSSVPSPPALVSPLSTIGLVIGFGVMMGRVLEVTGAGQRMAVCHRQSVGQEQGRGRDGADGLHRLHPDLL